MYAAVKARFVEKSYSENFPKHKFKFLYFKVIKDAIHRQDKAALRDT